MLGMVSWISVQSYLEMPAEIPIYSDSLPVQQRSAVDHRTDHARGRWGKLVEASI